MRKMNLAHPGGNPSCRVSSSLILVMFVALAILLCSGPGGAKSAPLDKKTKTAIIDSLCVALNETYVFPDVAKNMEKLIRKNLKEGTYATLDNLSDFTGRLTADLQSVSHDKHLWVLPLPSKGPDDFRVKFNRNASGDVIEFVGMYDNGTTDSSKRDTK